MLKRKYIVIGFLVFCLTAALFIGITTSGNRNRISATTNSATTSIGEYDPWIDLNNDGWIDIFDIVMVAGHFGTTGEPFAAKAALEYDSGWFNITDKAGQYFNVTHNLNSTNVIADITGKTTISGGVHQIHFGGTGYTPGWSKTYGGTGLDIAESVVQTGDGGYAIAGRTESFGAGLWDFWLVKTDSAGNVQWNQTYGGTDYDWAWSVVQTSDGGYAIAGKTDSFGAGLSDFWLVKTDSAGNMQWNQTYGGTGGDYAHSVVQTSDGGYAIAGDTGSFGAGGWDFWLVKTNSAGNVQWNQTYGGTNEDIAFSVVQTSDGGYAIAGQTNSFGAGSYDFWLVKTDSAGNMQWNQTYGGGGWDGAWSVVQTSDGGYAIAGSTGDFWLVKTDPAGNMQWNQKYGGTSGDDAMSVVQTGDGGYAIAGDTSSFGAGNYDFWLVKTGVESGLAWTDSTPNTITLYRGRTDAYWNYVRVRIWKI